MKKNTIIVCAALAMLSLSGCATILKGDTQKVNIATSNGDKIQATVNGNVVQVPGVVEVTRHKAELMVTTSAANCTPSTVVNNEIEPVFFVNILSGGVLGSTTDYASESMWRYDENININCK